MADPRTSIAVPPKLKKRCQKMAEAAYPPIGWTQQLVILAQAELERRDTRAPRLPSKGEGE